MSDEQAARQAELIAQLEAENAAALEAYLIEQEAKQAAWLELFARQAEPPPERPAE